MFDSRGTFEKWLSLWIMTDEKKSITISLNGKAHRLENQCCVASFLAEQGLGEAQGVAVAINNKVVRRQNWETTELVDGDSVVLLTAVQGG